MKKIIATRNAPAPIGPYNQAVKHGNTLYVSGQIALHPKTGELHTASIDEETHLVFENLKGVLAAADMSLSNVVKATIFISDMDQFAAINAVYASYFTENFPARECVEVRRLPKDVNVEISVIAID